MYNCHNLASRDLKSLSFFNPCSYVLSRVPFFQWHSGNVVRQKLVGSHSPLIKWQVMPRDASVATLVQGKLAVCWFQSTSHFTDSCLIFFFHQFCKMGSTGWKVWIICLKPSSSTMVNGLMSMMIMLRTLFVRTSAIFGVLCVFPYNELVHTPLFGS